MKRSLRIDRIWLLALALVLCCVPAMSQDLEKKNYLTEDQEKTLASLKLVNDYPSYTMTYFADYGFSRLLKTGVYPHFIASPDSEAKYCSTMAALNTEGDVFYGRNLDWIEKLPTCILFTDPDDGYASVSVTSLPHFEQYYNSGSDSDKTAFIAAPYMLHDGMNECGVAIAEMSVGPDPEGGQDSPDKVTISGLDIIRLVLERAASVDEAIELIKQYNNRQSHLAHYLVADAGGHSAVIEYRDKKLVVTRNREPWQVCTNFKILQADPEEIRSRGYRYPIVYDALKARNGKVSEEEMQDIVQSVNVNSPSVKTEWSSLYNLTTGKLLFFTARDFDHPDEYHLEMSNDLEIKKIKIKTNTVRRGGKARTNVIIKNSSVRPSGETTLKIGLVKKKTNTIVDVAEVNIPPLKQQEAKTLKVKYLIPGNQKAGVYRIEARILTEGYYKDYKPENNTMLSSKKIRITH